MDYRPLGPEGWHASDTLTFKVDALKQQGQHGFSMGLRTSSAHPYPYRQLTLAVRQEWRDSTSTILFEKTDTCIVDMATETGDLSGDGVSTYQYDLPIDTLSLPAGSRGTIQVCHLMRRSPLPGIVSVGIRLHTLP